MEAQKTDKPTRAVAGWCLNYNGFANSAECRGGVNYKELAGTNTALLKVLPCTNGDDLSGCVNCPKMAMPTADQVKEWNDHTNARFAKIMEARSTIVAESKKTGAKSGTIECPQCKSRLSFSIASNGHVHARCATAECLSWME